MVESDVAPVTRPHAVAGLIVLAVYADIAGTMLELYTSQVL